MTAITHRRGHGHLSLGGAVAIGSPGRDVFTALGDGGGGGGLLLGCGEFLGLEG